MNFVHDCLLFENPESQVGPISVNGALTSFLRARWGLLKDRADSDRHHALDAVVVACCTQAMKKRVAEYSKNHELKYVQAGYTDIETGEIFDIAALRKLEARFPLPWEHFRDELLLRLFCKDRQILQTELTKFGTYAESEIKSVKPLFVSRAIQRRGTGALHKETIYSQTDKQKQTETVTRKVRLQNLKEKDFDNLVDYERNKKLYVTIRTKLEKAGWNGKKAFPEGTMNMIGKNGEQTDVLVKSVRITEKKTGVSIRGGLAENGLMRRVDVFRKNGQYFLVPVYFWQKELPNRAVSAHKPENQWVLIDEQFEWCFSIMRNDLIHVKLKDREYLGYFDGLNRANGSISIVAHDRAKDQGKEGIFRDIGVRYALNITKLSVDVLGNIYRVAPEPRHELA